MTARLVGALVVLALVGAGVGYALAPDAPDAASVSTFDPAAPVPAADPRLPVEIFRADPEDAALETAIPLTLTRLEPAGTDGQPSTSQLRVPVPVGWTESRPTSTRWMYTVPGNDTLAFGLRIDILADTGLSVDSAKQSRESELRSALLQESFTDLDITEDRPDGFTAVYVQDGYQRYSIEQFYPGPDPDSVFASVAVYGRARDVTGLTDLLERISIDLRAVQTP